MHKVAIFAKKHDPRCQGVADDLINWLEERECQPLVEVHLASHIGYHKGTTAENIREQAELVVVLGGDGTLISVARLFSGREVPIVGVNLGSLGFLTEVTVEELYPVLELCLKGHPHVSERMMLEVSVRREGREIEKHHVLNDIVINKGALARIIDLETKVNGHPLTTYRADGLIISTPTGSTGYSLSAGGPIIHPQMSCIVITPICPHTLTNRPIVVSDASNVSITVASSYDEKVYLTLDGQVGFELMEKDSVDVRAALKTTALVMSRSRDYYEVLRTKLKWGGQ
ncbi:NAD(+)/NADH kinase [Oryzomonas japonica]|uniref:NAD kinase n=1 Tax=Oryzomonas japonica TaxID=2603858 RepID=A0A7J4ZPR0_9BACT|nr:NAD(+)/NADH kinase [Oryzomonas japonica]KAB0664883.1 NAD(+)/NADH kinase [Oryzomonas japonica]